MPDNLRPNLMRPEQQVRQRIANFIFWQFGYLNDLFLRVGTAANRFAHAVGRRKFPEQTRNSPRRKGSLVIQRDARTIGTK